MKTRIGMLIVLLLVSTTAFADALRSDRHLLKIEASGAVANRQYNVQIFSAESRQHIAHLKLATKGDTGAEAETAAGGVTYKARVETFSESYVVTFTATEGGEVIDTMRGGFAPKKVQQPVPSRAVRSGREVNAPKVIRRVEPTYTEDAKTAGAIGTVILEVLIDKGGFVRETKVVKAMGYGLTESAIDAVTAWQFEPSLHQRMPVEVVHEVTLEFKP